MVGGLALERVGFAQHQAERRFPAGSEQYGETEGRELRKVADEQQILAGRLPEPEAGVGPQLLGADARIGGQAEGALDVAEDFGPKVLIIGFFPTMHEDQRAAGAGADLGHRRHVTPEVVARAFDIVDQVGALRERGRGDLRLVGIDRKRGPREPLAEEAQGR